MIFAIKPRGLSNSPIYQTRFESLKCCILVPTYNNQKSLPCVLQDLQLYTSNIIVVNDGSTDNTREILKNFSHLEIRHFPKNKGKGAALDHGFRVAGELGYDYAISIDSDGQHYPDDLGVFLDELENKPENGPEILLVGDRNMGRDGIPGKSSMGNKFSNFWYLVVTGTQLSDTQSGYRLYPLQKVNPLKLYTNKFEYEIEIIVKASWRGVAVKNIPIKVLYEENRVTHFRPFWDITRIVLLYMWFVLVSFFYIHPRDKYRQFRDKGFERFWREDIIKSDEPAHKKAAAVALGVFVGISPFWGLHTLLVFLLAAIFKLNKVIAFIFSNISIPPLIPFIIYASYQMGSLLTGKGIEWDLRLSDFDSGAEVLKGLGQYILGSFALAGIVALFLWIVFYFLFSVNNQKQVVKP
jgi:glycosyltransferase involved in cell wall biosynthesis